MGEVSLRVVCESECLMRLVYKFVKQLPKSEQYVSIPQILRSALSVGSNLAEGSAKSGKDFKRFIDISRGSLRELEFQIKVTSNEYNINCGDLFEKIDELGRMTFGLKRSIK